MSLLGPLIFSLLVVHLEGHKNAKRDTLVRFEDVKRDLNLWKQKIHADLAALRAENQQMKLAEEQRFQKLEKDLLPPVGFIYIQYGSQSAPGALWPGAQWESVTHQYAGAFFRAEGGHSLTFGKNQGESMRTLNFQFTDSMGEQRYTNLPYDARAYVTAGGYTGGWTGFFMDYNQRHMSYATRDRDNEVRPFNQAVRIWKRIA